MLFNSADYVLFLGLVLPLYWGLRRFAGPRLFCLFAASCAFYMAWHPAYILLILFSTVVDFSAGLLIGQSERANHRKAFLLLSLVCNLGLLGLFKYFNFAVQATADVLGLFNWCVTSTVVLAGAALGLLDGVTVPPVTPAFGPLQLNVALPVGISFYTFQTLSYTIDVYRGAIKPTRNPLKFAVFVMFFPQLVAGPIVRAKDFLPQLNGLPFLRTREVSEGLAWIATGLIKKVIIADFLSVNLVDRVFDDPGRFSATEVVLALYGFTMQIYCDFSGYTDVARGSARLLGFQLPENFDRPYAAPSPAEFWRRWHMTLSSWLRDYLYFPLGGSRGSPLRSYINLWITMFLIGIWHGAAWTFVVYALLQSTAMVVHRYWYRHTQKHRTTPEYRSTFALKVLWNLQFVVFSRIFFRATGWDNAAEVMGRLTSGTTSVAQVSAGVGLVLLGSFALHYTPRRWYTALVDAFTQLKPALQGLVLLAIFVALAKVATSEVVPYIYFQF